MATHGHTLPSTRVRWCQPDAQIGSRTRAHGHLWKPSGRDAVALRSRRPPAWA